VRDAACQLRLAGLGPPDELDVTRAIDVAPESDAPKFDAPTARQRGYLRALERHLGVAPRPTPATRGGASLEITRLHAQLKRAADAQNDARARANAQASR